MTDREQDVAIAKAIGIEVVMWPFEHDPECGGMEPISEDWDNGTPDFGPSLGEDGEFAKIRKETAAWLPSYRFVGGHNIPDDVDWYDHEPIPDYNTPSGSWLILDYIRENPDDPFTERFLYALQDLVDGPETPWLDPFSITVTSITPALIKAAAWRAVQ